MKVLVLGAGGKTGQRVVAEALGAGHEVTAFVREPAEFDDGVKLVVGDAMTAADVDGALAGQDAVIDAIGGKTPYKDSGLEASTARVLLAAMGNKGIRRLLVISALGVGDSGGQASFFYEHVLMNTMLRGVASDKGKMEQEVEAARDIEFTIVRPGLLTDDEDAPPLRVFTGEETAHKTARRDLARFLVAQVDSDQYSRQAVVVANS